MQNRRTVPSVEEHPPLPKLQGLWSGNGLDLQGSGNAAGRRDYLLDKSYYHFMDATNATLVSEKAS